MSTFNIHRIQFVAFGLLTAGVLNAQDPFITTWKTDNPGVTNTNSIRIPTASPTYIYLYDVDWNNDGTYDEFGVSGDVDHDFGSPGTYTIRIRGDFPKIYFNNSGDRSKFLSVDQWGDQQWAADQAFAFAGCENLAFTAIDTPDLSAVTSMYHMIANATGFNSPMNHWDVSNVTSIAYIFANDTAFNQPLNQWDVSNVINMWSAFENARSFNQPLNQWEPVSCGLMISMFQGATAFDQNLGTWNVESLNTMQNMFAGVTLSQENYDSMLISWSQQSLKPDVQFSGGNSTYCRGAVARQLIIENSGWAIIDGGISCSMSDHFVMTYKTDNPGVSNNTSITIPTYLYTAYNYDVDWDNDGVFDSIGVTGNITHDYGVADTVTVRIRGAFPKIYFEGQGDAQKLLAVDQWGSTTWTDMSYAFYGCTHLEVSASDAPDLSLAISLSYMFADTKLQNSDLSSWNLSTIVFLDATFQGSKFNGNINSWDVSNVKYFLRMFQFDTAYNQPLDQWNTGSAVTTQNMFDGATKFNQDIGSWDVSQVQNMVFMFHNSTFNQDIGTWDVGSVTDMSAMFRGASEFNQDLSNWNTSSVIRMDQMFHFAFSFDHQLGSWDIQQVTHMPGMLHGVTLSTENYDSTLIGWSHQTLQSGVSFSAGNSQFCQSAVPRQNLINTFGWNIVDGGINCDPIYDLITTWKTNNPGQSNSTSISIPAFGDGYDYDVDWDNDGVFDSIGVTGNITHDYGVADTVTIRIRGAFPRIYFNNTGDRLKLRSVDQWGGIMWTSMEQAFSGCENMIIVATDAPDLRDVTSLANMFAWTINLEGDLSGWDVSSVTDLSQLFYLSGFNGHINTWDVSNVTNMHRVFNLNEQFNQPLDQWNTSAVHDMSGLFGFASSFNQDISGWDVGQVTDMTEMFVGATAFNQPLGNWDVGSVENMITMFSHATAFNQDISGWDVGHVTDMRAMFINATAFDQPIGDWDVGAVTAMSSMFRDAISFNQDISSWDVSQVTDMTEMFRGAVSFNQDISGWDVGNVTNMTGMFFENPVFDQPIGSWNVSHVESMLGMFGLSGFNQDISGWDVGSVTDMGAMFLSNPAFNQPIGSWNVDSVMNMYGMFNGAISFNQNIGSWHVSSVTLMNDMLLNTALTTANYDSILIGWSQQSVQSNVVFNIGTSHYCAGATARQELIDSYGWMITDGGERCASDWTGNVSSDWFETQNWSDGVPTDYLKAFVPNVDPQPYPLVGLPGAVCREIETSPGTSLTIAAHATLHVLGQ